MLISVKSHSYIVLEKQNDHNWNFPSILIYRRRYEHIHYSYTFLFYTIKMTSYWAQWRIKSPALRLLTQSFIQAQIKENIKTPRHWPLCGEFTGDRWIPRTNGQ